MSKRLQAIRHRVDRYDKALRAIKGLPGRGEKSDAPRLFLQAAESLKTHSYDDLCAVLAVAEAAEKLMYGKDGGINLISETIMGLDVALQALDNEGGQL